MPSVTDRVRIVRTMTQIEQLSVERKRTGWDIVWGILLIIGGLIVLGDVVIATVVSVLFVGWTTLASSGHRG